MQTEEELAKAEALRLRALESERLRRMRPDADANAEGGTRITDDDLVDDFDLPLGGTRDADEDGDEEVEVADEEDEEYGDDNGEDDEVDDGECEDDHDDEDVKHGASARDDFQMGSDDKFSVTPEGGDISDKDDGNLDVSGAGQAQSARSSDDRDKRRSDGVHDANGINKIQESQQSDAQELPYVFNCPSTAKELETLMNIAGADIACQREVLHRLIAGHHTKLREENKAKLNRLVELLIDRLMQSADDAPTQALHPLCPAIFAIAQQLPVQCALVIMPRLQTCWRSFSSERKEMHAAAKSASKLAKGNPPSTGPSRARLVTLPPRTLSLIALCVQLFPLTDFRHVIMTPCNLFAAEVLSQSEVCNSMTLWHISRRASIYISAMAL